MAVLLAAPYRRSRMRRHGATLRTVCWRWPSWPSAQSPPTTCGRRACVRTGTGRESRPAERRAPQAAQQLGAAMLKSHCEQCARHGFALFPSPLFV